MPIGAEEGGRTLMRLPSRDFESRASAIPPLRQSCGAKSLKQAFWHCITYMITHFFVICKCLFKIFCSICFLFLSNVCAKTKTARFLRSVLLIFWCPFFFFFYFSHHNVHKANFLQAQQLLLVECCCYF